MTRNLLSLAATLLASMALTAKAGELDAEFGKTKTLPTTTDKVSGLSRHAAVSDVLRRTPTVESELDSESPTQSCFLFGRGMGFGYGGFGGMGFGGLGMGWGGMGMGYGGMGWGGMGMGYGGMGWGGMGFGGFGYRPFMGGFGGFGGYW